MLKRSEVNCYAIAMIAVFYLLFESLGRTYMEKKEEIKTHFLKKYWIVFLAILLLIVVTYFPKLSNFNYSVDTERMIRFPDYTLNWWLRLGRYGLVVLTKIPLFGKGTQIEYINYLTYGLMLVSGIGVAFLFDKEAQRLRIEHAIALGLFVTTPIILEQTNFVLQSAPVVFSTNIMFVGYGLLRKFLQSRKLYWLLAAVLLIAFSFSVYVSLVMGFISLTIVDLAYQSKKKNWTVKEYLFQVIYFASSCIFSYGLYIIGNMLCFKLFNLKSTNYLSESKLWGKIPNDQVIQTIKGTLKNNFKFDSPFVFWGALLLLLLFIVTALFSKQKITIIFITTIGLVVVGTYTVPLFGYFGTIRSYYPVYPIIIYGLAMCVFQSTKISFIKLLVSLSMIAIVGLQAHSTYLFGENENSLYKAEVKYVGEIETKLKNLGITDYGKYELAVIGGKVFEKDIQGDMLGNSVFAWDIPSNVGASYRAGDFMFNHGLTFRRITPKDYSKAQAIAGEMTIFPDENSIRIIDEQIVAIRLN